jgi:hypothetical protein
LNFGALGEKVERAHDTGGQKGCPMALDTNIFLVILIAAIAVMSLVIWLRFRFEKKRRSQ